MTSELLALCCAASDPVELARFWAAVLDAELVEDDGHETGGVALLPADDPGFRIRFLRTTEPKAGPNRLHLDVTSTSLDDQAARVAKALDLGASHLDVGQEPDAQHVVLADPEGNEFCVIEPDNAFLAGCGLIGALSCDGSQQVGHFWSEALGWPLVWDQDQETAIQAPRGGPKITWGGSSPRPRVGVERVHLDLVAAGGDHAAELERLLALGARRAGAAGNGAHVLLDPDGGEFCVGLSYPASPVR